MTSPHSPPGREYFLNQARTRNTFLLSAAMVLASTALVCLLVYIAAGFLARALDIAGDWSGPSGSTSLLLLSVGPVLAAVVGGTIAEFIDLFRVGAGPHAAGLLGGKIIGRNSADPRERRLLDLSERMAVAAGVTPPAVYVVEEEAVNAFAAGLSPNEAALVVTRGALKALSRDELEGVVAHEFSHILDGSARLNVGLLGLLSGLVVVTWIGQGLAWNLWQSRKTLKGRTPPAWLLAGVLGLVLWVVGLGGVLLARLIKLAVVRRTEFGADACGAAMTRNPAALARALCVVANHPTGSRIIHPGVEKVSHFFFVEAVGGRLAWLFSTHPPLRERVRRLEPSLANEVPEQDAPRWVLTAKQWRARALASLPWPPSPGEAGAQGGRSRTIDDLVQSIGHPGPESVDYAARILDSLPPRLASASHDVSCSRAVVCALLLNREPDVRGAQMAFLRSMGDPALLHEVEALAPLTDALPAEARLPLVELCLASLRDLSERPRSALLQAVDALVEADGQTALFEIAVRLLVRKHLRALPAVGLSGTAIQERRAPEWTLLTALAWAGHAGDRAAAQAAFDRGLAGLGRPVPAFAQDVGQPPTSAEVESALVRLSSWPPQKKRALTRACAACGLSDGEMRVREAELLRIIGAVLDVPIPPLLFGFLEPPSGIGVTTAGS